MVVQTGRPDAFYARLTELAASRRARRDPRGHVARRQPAGRLPVSGEVMTTTSASHARPPTPGVLASAAARSSTCRSARCCGRAARFSWRCCVGGAGRARGRAAASSTSLHRRRCRVNGAQVGGPAIFGMMIWLLYIRFIVPVLGVFYGTSLIADEVDDKTITYLFTRPIPRGAVLLGKYLAYLVCTVLLVLPSVMLVYFLIVPIGGGSIGAAFPVAADGPRHAGSGWRPTGRCSRWSAPGSSGRWSSGWSSPSAGSRRPAVSRLPEAAHGRLLPAGAGAARDAAGFGRQHAAAGVPRGAVGAVSLVCLAAIVGGRALAGRAGRSSSANTCSNSEASAGRTV